MKKETFTNILKELKKSMDHAELIGNCLEQAFEGNNRDILDIRPYQLSSLFCDGTCYDNILHILENEFDDEGCWISYFIYEKDWGLNQNLRVWEDDGCTEIPLNTIEDLYDFLIMNQIHKKEYNSSKKYSN